MSERFMKSIPARDVRNGDVITSNDLHHPRGYEVVSVSDRGALIRFKDNHGCEPQIGSTKFVTLLHRPWPEGKTEEDMLNLLGAVSGTLAVEIQKQASSDRTFRVTTLIEGVRRILDAYELGKPFDQDKLCQSGRCSHPKRLRGAPCIGYEMKHYGAR